MKKTLAYLIIFFGLALFAGSFLTSHPATAANTTTNTTNTTAPSTNTSAGVAIPTGYDKNNKITTTQNSFNSWGDYLSAVYRFAEYIGFALATLMIVYGGVMYVTSQGDGGKIGTAKEYVIGALVGMALLYLVNVLAKYLNITGIK